MIFNFNDFLMAISATLDFVEMDLLGITSNHSKRVAYISLRLSKEFDLSIEEQIDIVSLSILHDNGLTELLLQKPLDSKNNFSRFIKEEKLKDHCIIGERNIKKLPLHSKAKNIIKYHHENYDGSGFFGLKGKEIPLMAQIISFADNIDFKFNYQNPDIQKKLDTISFVKDERNKKFSSYIIDKFLKISEQSHFWEDLKDINIEKSLSYSIPTYRQNLSIDSILEIMKLFSKIIDNKSHFTKAHSSGLADKVSAMCDSYRFSYEEKMKLIIAAKLHDIGKLAIPNAILDKPGKLTDEEFFIIQKHAYYTKTCLEKIKGFEEITKWASNHHEKLNGRGYPYGLNSSDLDFNSRLMACLDIYQALTEERPYRKPLSHKEAVNILKDMAKNNLVDKNIVSDLDKVFYNCK